jgi:hypothetical protein
MKKMILSAVALSFCLSCFARADVVIQRKSTIKNPKGSMEIESLETQYIKGDKSRVEISMNLKNKFPESVPNDPGLNQIMIIHIDKQLIWMIDTAAKTYSEISFTGMKEMLGNLRDLFNGDSSGKTTGEEYEWTINIKRPKSIETIKDFTCKGTLVQAIGVNKKESTDSLMINCDIWYDTSLATGVEALAFSKKYYQALNLDLITAQLGSSPMLKLYSNLFKCLSDSLKNEKGIPIKADLGFEKIGRAQVGKMAEDDTGKVQKTTMDEVSFNFLFELLSIQETPIDDGIFELPAGYEKKGL